jgi:hypothetical protein
MPGEDGELAGDGDDRDRVTAPGGDPGVEAMERTRSAGRTEGSLDEQAPNVALAGMADVAGVGRAGAGLADDRVEPEIADELVRRGKRRTSPMMATRPTAVWRPMPGNRQQASDPPIVDNRPGDPGLGDLDLGRSNRRARNSADGRRVARAQNVTVPTSSKLYAARALWGWLMA